MAWFIGILTTLLAIGGSVLLVIATWKLCKKGSWRDFFANLLFIVLALGLMYLKPEYFNWFFYKVIWANFSFVIAAIVGIALIREGLKTVPGEFLLQAGSETATEELGDAGAEGSEDVQPEADGTGEPEAAHGSDSEGLEAGKKKKKKKKRRKETKEEREIREFEEGVAKWIQRARRLFMVNDDVRPVWEQSGAKATLLIFLGVTLGAGIAIFSASAKEWQIAMAYQPRVIEQPEVVDPTYVRVTPSQVVATLMSNRFNESDQEVDLSQIEAIDLNGGFGFAAPIVPQGFWNIWQGQAGGVYVFDDGHEFERGEAERLRQIPQTFTVGQGMQYFDSLERRLLWRNPFAVYGQVYYLQLDAENPDTFTIVAPYTRYSPTWWGVMVPRFAGVTLVSSDGSFENVQAAAIPDDPRLNNKPLFPRELAARIVSAQRFDQGIMSGWIRREGKIQIPEDENGRELPVLLARLTNGSYQEVMPTEPDGSARGLFRIFFIDAASGDFSMAEIDPQEQVLGPLAARDRVFSLPNYLWYREVDGKTQGNHVVLDPVYFVREESELPQIYWLFAISHYRLEGITSVVAVNAHNYEMTVFREDERPELEAWLAGNLERETGAIDPADEQAVIRNMLNDAMEDLLRAMEQLE